MPVFMGYASVSYLEKYIIENNIETIITSGHRTAYILSV
jgi:hypothetical protein